ncbi:MAG: tetratricopeptide repeat protein, partial [Actinomycetota bacterium]|nr:tetratricopeptide repeat protein [Actinomycetota bacterium]
NFEQILDAAPLVGDLLDAAPELTIMVTSRSPLGLSWEQEFPIAPLAVPATSGTLTPDSVEDYDAVALFVARSRSSHPSFTIDADNAADIAEITARLDGLPLAIELAAARMKLLTPSDLLARMRDHRPALAEGPTDVAQRHRTLSDAIAWSYDVLEPEEQMLFRRLGVFRTFTIDAATTITGIPETSVFDGVDSLFSKSLVYRNDTGGHARFGMLETLREFALERLEAADERDEITGHHAAYFQHLAEQSEMHLTRDSAHDTIQMLTAEIDNIRNALQYSTGTGHPDLGLSLAGSVWRFYQSTGRLIEGRQWLEALLAMPQSTDAARAKGLTGLAGLAYWQGNYEEASHIYEDALACFRAVGDRFGEADTLFGMSMSVAVHGDSERGERLATEARSIFEELGSREKIGQVYMAQAALMHVEGRHAEARPFWEAALGIARELGDHQLAITELIGIGICEYHDGNLDEALRIALESLDAAAGLENVQVAIWLLDYIAAFSVAANPSEAVRLAGAVDALRRGVGGGMSFDTMGVEDARTAASRSLSSDEIYEAWSTGRAMTLDEAIDYARGFDRLVGNRAVPPTTH